ncbi:MAG: PQQ-dependent sugar dehydrogenase, partial [Chloroflexia bacterium]
PAPASNHNAGDLNFGKDGMLYISVGDGGCDYANNSGCAGANDASRDKDVLFGKILRITRDGAIPADNPWVGTDSGRCNVNGTTTAAKCREMFAWGLRNPSGSLSAPTIRRRPFTSTTSGRTSGRRLTSRARAPTTAGTAAKVGTTPARATTATMRTPA